MLTILATCLSLFSYVNQPCVDMREEPNQSSELVSQGYFSEPVEIVDDQGDWIKIETKIDKYRGWVKKGAICQRKTAYLSDAMMVAKVNRARAHVYNEKDTIYGPVVTLPFESKLEVLDFSHPRWVKISLVDGKVGYIQKGDISLESRSLSLREICDLSLRFLDLPYTWAGRSSLGYDCSGFVQMLYRQMGFFIPRDSKDQICWEGFVEIPLDKMRPGDLIFFGRLPKKRIHHVGLYLGGGKFIHSGVADNTPYIRISDLNDDTWSEKHMYRAGRTLKK